MKQGLQIKTPYNVEKRKKDVAEDMVNEYFALRQ